MWLDSLTLDDFSIFKSTNGFKFEKLNYINGLNGTGKSTLSLNSLLFCLYGYSAKKLSELPSKGSDDCSITSHWTKDDKKLSIWRSYPTEIEIMENDIEVKLANNNEKQKWLNNTFGDLNYFKKFRTIDRTEGISIVDEGYVSLKKTLLSLNEDKLNSVKEQLLKVKSDREMHSRDLVMSKHYPSERRLEYLTVAINDLNYDIKEATEARDWTIRELNEMASDDGQLKGRKYELILKMGKIRGLGKECPVCNQPIPDSMKANAIRDLNHQISEIDEMLKQREKNPIELKNECARLNSKISALNGKKTKLLLLKQELERRIEQKDYKYTERDVLIAKNALVELDKFSSYYLAEYAKTIEPMMNSILSKIGFEINFELDQKGNFSFSFLKDGIKYSKEDLSTGQRLVLQIGLKLALLMERGESGLIVADEGMSSLDRENLMHVIDMFNALPFQLILVAHHVETVPNYMKVINL